jgi:membrane-associated phospholipid phosphatase
VGSSFPSGHVAAAACYAAVAIVVFWHTRNWWLRALTVVVVALTPVAVALARMYRGMHYLTDVVAGAILGAAAVLVATWILLRAERRRLARDPELGQAVHDRHQDDADDDPDDELVGATSATNAGTTRAAGSS